MTVLAPAWIVFSAVASLAVAAIHLIAWRLPRTVVLPTARFVPDEPARRAARTIRPSDLALLALRVAILMAGGLAMAQPRFNPAPGGSATVVAIEHSRAVGDTAMLRDSVRAVSGEGVVSYVVFDTSTRTFSDRGAALAATSRSGAPAEASLTAALVAAIREARRLERQYENVRIVIASTFSRRSFDQATSAVRRSWEDSVRLLRIPVRRGTVLPANVVSSSPVDDPVIAGIRLAMANGLVRGASRVIREPVASIDSLTIDSGEVVVLWPRALAGAAERVDGIHAGGYAAIGHFTTGLTGDTGHVIARWINGAPAAWQYSRGAGCLRTIGFDVPDVGDFTLTPSFQHLAARLLEPCMDGPADVAADSIIGALIAPGTNDAGSARLEDRLSSNRLAAALLVFAVVLAITELWFRRRTGSFALEQRA